MLICKQCREVFKEGSSCLCKDVSSRRWTVGTEESIKLLESEKVKKISKQKTKRGKSK